MHYGLVQHQSKNQQKLENPTNEMKNIILYYNCIFDDLHKIGYTHIVKVNKDNFMVLTDNQNNK